MILHFVMTFSSVLMKGMCTYVLSDLCKGNWAAEAEEGG